MRHGSVTYAIVSLLCNPLRDAPHLLPAGLADAAQGSQGQERAFHEHRAPRFGVVGVGETLVEARNGIGLACSLLQRLRPLHQMRYVGTGVADGG